MCFLYGINARDRGRGGQDWFLESFARPAFGRCGVDISFDVLRVHHCDLPVQGSVRVRETGGYGTIQRCKNVIC
jgi:hypothetical protein